MTLIRDVKWFLGRNKVESDALMRCLTEPGLSIRGHADTSVWLEGVTVGGAKVHIQMNGWRMRALEVNGWADRGDDVLPNWRLTPEGEAEVLILRPELELLRLANEMIWKSRSSGVEFGGAGSVL